MRDGKADFNEREVSSPFVGQRSYILELGKNFIIPILKAMENYEYDFDVTKIKPTHNTVYIKRDNVAAIENYEADLENIDSSWVREYINWVKRGMEINKDGVERLARERAKDQATTVDEDGDEVAISELAIDQACSIESYQLKQEIPYYVKRLATFGDKYGIHMMSFIIAIEKAKQARSAGLLGSANKNDGKPKQSEILMQKVYKSNGANGYLVDENGEPILWEKNNTVFRDYIYPFVKGNVVGEDKQFYNDYLHLLMNCNQLGIDLRFEDPREYTTELMSDITVTYVMNNKEYLNKLYHSNYMATVLNTMSISDYSSSGITAQKTTSIYDIIRRKVSEFNSLDNAFFLNLRNVTDTQQLVAILRMYKLIYNNTSTDLSDYTYSNGFLADSYGRILEFNANILLNIKHTSVKKKNYFMIHKSGVLVLLDTGYDIKFLAPSLYEQYFDDIFSTARRIKVPFNEICLGEKIITKHLVGKEYKGYRRGFGYWPIAARS